MSILLLHEPNVGAAKTALRSLLPEIRSGHLTEALAAGLGYRTHAALLAGMAVDAERFPDVAEIDEGAFAARIEALGYAAPAFGLLDAVVRSVSIPDRPFVEFRDGDRAANNAHYAACLGLGRPMMMVRTARIYATLDWEIVTLSISDINSLFADVDGKRFSRIMLERFQALAAGAPGKPEFTGAPDTGWIKKLLPDTARQLAEDYFRMLYLPMRQFARR
jgi:hypothetical protein